jgi:hypothetical protein
VKADIVAFLLGSRGAWASVRDIAAATSYTPAAVRRAALDLVSARFLEERDGSPTAYRAPLTRWAGLLDLGDEPPFWADWHSKFLFVDALARWATVAGERPLSPYAFGVQARELLERHRTAFSRDQVATWSDSSYVEDWGEFATRAIESLTQWMTESA